MPILSNNLPSYSGPYKVATTDLEIPANDKRSFGTARLKATKEPALVLETVLFTLFYPTDSPSRGHRQRHQPWLERPLSRTVQGYARFTGKSKYLLFPAFWLIAGGTRLPATLDGPLAEKKKEMTEGVNGGVPASDDLGSKGSSTTAVGEGEDDSFPLVVFSHGLGSNRTTYSQYCGELASHGYIVAALEHRDGSGPTTTIYSNPSTPSRTVEYLTVAADLYFAEPDPTLSQLEFRKEQLVMRQAEVEEALGVLERINNGEGGKIKEENRRASEMSWKGWEGKIRLKDPSMAGHSFGGATTLQVLRAGKSYPFTRGIALDPWVDPIPKIELATGLSHIPSTSASSAAGDPPEQVGTDINVPLLVINSEAFTIWLVHYKEVRKIVEGVKEDAESWLATLGGSLRSSPASHSLHITNLSLPQPLETRPVGSIHLSFSDFPLIAPFLAKRAGSRIDPRQAMSTFIAASLEFLSGQGKEGKWLGGEVRPGDEKGTREGEGYAKEGKGPMKEVGDLRLHVRPRL